MTLQWRPRAGAHERQLRRRVEYPLLFGVLEPGGAGRLAEAREADDHDATLFGEAFHAVVQEAVGLAPNTPSERILELKDRLDMLYTQAASLAGDLTRAQDALQRLVLVVWDAVRAGAEEDPAALARLEDEAQARRAHWELLKLPLVADLLREDSIVPPEELLPTLLSAPDAEALAAFSLFPGEQQRELCARGHELLGGLEGRGIDVRGALKRLEELESVAVEAP